MTGGTGRDPRLVVGISRSPASWWALAWAVGEARRRGARLMLVNVFRPPLLPSPVDVAQGYPGTYRDPYPGRVATGGALIRTAIGQAVGQMPADVIMEQQVICGRAAAELASLAWGGDVIVLGSRRRGRLRRLAPGSVARACARRAGCPVMVVPEPSPTAFPAPWPTGPAHGHWLRRGPRRQARAAS